MGVFVSIFYGGGKRVRHPCLPAPSSAVSPFVKRRKAGVWGAPPYAYTNSPTNGLGASSLNTASYSSLPACQSVQSPSERTSTQLP